MDSNIKTAIEVLVTDIKAGVKGDEALKLTQAALNLAHVARTLKGIDD